MAHITNYEWRPSVLSTNLIPDIFLVVLVDGAYRHPFIIDDYEEQTKCKDLLDSVIKLDKEYRSKLKALMELLMKYDQEDRNVTDLASFLHEEGLLWEIKGDQATDQSEKENCYGQSMVEGNNCGACKLGRLLAQKNDRENAKHWIQEAAIICPRAEMYLDQYGLR